jgi:phosphoesterase RecJ-like protein
MSGATDFDRICDKLLSARHIVVVSHTNPDADAYGSSCGLAWGLKALGKSVAVYNDSGFIPRYQIIPGAADVIKGAWPALQADDLLVVCDCGGADRVGDALIDNVKAAACVINIDHHTSNTLFGDLNLVVESASSTSELIFDLLKGLEAKTQRNDVLSHEGASCLMGGIIGDTGSFRYPSTSAKTFLAAHDLVLRGARPDSLTQELFARQSMAALKLQSDALMNLRLHSNGFAEVIVTQEMLKKHGADILDSESLAERARDIEGVRVAALYKQDVDLWRISLRTRQGIADVSLVAQSFGGGGHKAAAAFRWRKDFETLQKELQAAISQVLGS